jgi:hypothetical protein
MGIESLGESLLSGRRKTRKKMRKEENLGALITGGLTIANAMLKKKSEDFLQNENVLSQQMAYEKSATSAAQTQKDWENANNHIGGVNGWFKDKLRPQVKSQADLLIREERLSNMDEYNQYIENQLDTLIGEEDGDGLYGKFSTAFKTASSLAPTSQFNDYIKNKNPAYRNVGSAVAGWLRKENPSAEKALETIASSRYVKNQQAYNTALESYRGGLSANASLELADIAAQEFKQKPDEVITESKIIYVDHGREGSRVKVPVMQQTAKNRDGSTRTFQTAVSGNQLSEKFFSNKPIQVAQQVEIETVNAYTGEKIKSKRTLVTDPFGVPINNGKPYHLDAQSTGTTTDSPPTISAINIKFAETMMSPIDSSFNFRSPDDKALLKAAIASTDDTEAGKRKAVTFQKLTYGVSQRLQEQVMGGPSDTRVPLRSPKTSPFSKNLASDLAAEITTMGLLYTQKASADETPGTPLIQNLQGVVTDGQDVNGVLVALGLESLNGRSNYNAYQLPGQATVSLFNSALSPKNLEVFNESASEHAKTYVKNMVKASLEAGRVDGGNRSLWAMPLTGTGVTGAELLGVMSKQEEDQTQEEELLSTSDDFMGFKKTFTPLNEISTEPVQAPPAPSKQRRTTLSDFVKREEEIRDSAGLKSFRPNSLLSQ